MKLDSISIKDVIIDIEAGNIFLPPIQRSFVWKYDRIVNLFDSLYRNYPIGNCIFWRLTPETSRNYILYKFIKDYSENKSKTIINEIASRNLLEKDVYAIVDGQQRLSSLFIGLAGNYKYKKSGKGLKDVDANFISAKLFINLFSSESQEETPLFEFWGKEEMPLNDKNLWFEAGKVMLWKTSSEAEIVVDEILLKTIRPSNKKTVIARFESRKNKIITMLKTLYEMLNDKRVYFFDIQTQNLDEVVDIFTRVNSGGMTLKKSDLLFSLLVAEWHEGREEIQELIESMRESGVSISQDFIMRACLVLSDLPVKYKLESFTLKNISIIKQNWSDIKYALIQLCDLLPEIGYNEFLKNVSDNSLIPIAYYIKNGGIYHTQKAKTDLQKYYVISQLNGIFGSQSDQILEKIRAEIKRQLQTSKSIIYQELINLKLPGGKTFELSISDLEYLIETTTYGSPHAYFLLSLIYPTVDFKIKRYEVDHIHPRSKFNRSNLQSLGINEESINEWIEEKRDLLPNLQLLGVKDNSNKRAKTIIEYLKAKPIRERKEFMKENLLPNDFKIMELKAFDGFFMYRKSKLVNKLKSHLGL